MVANGVRTPGVSRKRTEFDSSALLTETGHTLVRCAGLLNQWGDSPP